jgi:putative MATE family efflux protein
MLVAALLQNTQSLIDLFWVGRLGAHAIAAVAISGTVLMVLFPLLMGLATGTVAHVARAVGGGRLQDATHAATQSLMLAIFLGIVSGAIGQVFSDSLLRLLGAEGDVVQAGGAYLRISLVGSFTLFLLFIANAALQGAGEAKITMKVMILSNIINIGLDPLLIFGLGPFPRLGVRGAALATVLAQAAAACLAVYVMASGRSRLTVNLRQYKPDFPLIGRILRIGIPGSGQMIARSLMGVMMMRLVAACGTAAVAAYGIGLRLHMVLLMPAFALGGAAATMVGQNLGAGKPDRARNAAWMATGVDAMFMAAGAAALILFAPALISAFNKDTLHAAEVVAIGSQYLRIVSPFYLFAALGIILGRALNGAGDSLAPMIVTILALWGIQVPLAVYLSRIVVPSTQGIWWAMCIASALQGMMVLFWFELGRWKRIRI